MLTSLWVELEFFKHQIIPIFGALSTTAWCVLVGRLHHKVPQFNDFSLYGAKKGAGSDMTPILPLNCLPPA